MLLVAVYGVDACTVPAPEEGDGGSIRHDRRSNDIMPDSADMVPPEEDERDVVEPENQKQVRFRY